MQDSTAKPTLQANYANRNMSLIKLRKKQQKIDEKIVGLLSERLKISEEIGQFKKKNGLKVEDKSVENEKIEHLIAKSSSKHITADFMRKIWRLIFARSKEIQQSLEIDPKDKK